MDTWHPGRLSDGGGQMSGCLIDGQIGSPVGILISHQLAKGAGRMCASDRQRTEPIVGRVIKVQSRFAFIEVPVKLSCGVGGDQNSCAPDRRLVTRAMKAQNSIDANVGDRVQVELPTNSVAKAAVWLFGLPVVLMLIVGIASHRMLSVHMGGQQNFLFTVLLVSAVPILLGVAVWLWRRVVSSEPNYPTVVRKVE